MGLFSLVIPMYNAEKHITRCIESIKNQTFHDFEVLLVNDGSIDDTLMCCKTCIDDDPRFKIITQISNTGVSAARNRGLREANGDWIWFIDADDWIDEKALEKISNRITDKVELIIFDYIKERNGNKIEVKNCFEDGTILDKSTFCENILSPDCHYQLVWSSIYRRTFLLEKGIYFDERLSLMEDSKFVLNVGKYVGSCLVVRLSLYHYIVNLNSASQKWKPDVGEMIMLAATEIYRAVSELQNPQLSDNLYHSMQDILRILILKDIFHPDNHLRWSERKRQMNRALEKEIFYEAIHKPYVGSRAKRVLWFCIVNRIYILLAMVSWMYYNVKGTMFWKVYAKTYRI